MITFKRQRFVKLHTYLQVCKVLITLPAINRPAQNVHYYNFRGLQSAMEALPEALLLEQRASFMEDPSRQHLWAYLPQPFCLLWQFLRLQVQWSHDNTSFSSKKYRRAPCHQPDPVPFLLRAPELATPTPTVHAFFRCTRWLSTFHRGARPVFTRPSQSERSRERDYPPNLFLFRKKELERASERERERERERELQ